MSVHDLIVLGCSSQQPTRKRNHGAYVLRWNQEGFLFDPGEGTQRQFIYANVAPSTVNRIFVSHFHGDHCLGLGSMLMRLNLDKVRTPIHCYYPKSAKKYFDRIRYGTIYHENIHVIEHPIDEEGVIDETDDFYFEAYYLCHGVDNLAYRIVEKDRRRFYKDKLKEANIKGPLVHSLEKEGSIVHEGKTYHIDDFTYWQKGDVFSTVIDTLPCAGANKAAKGARWLLCESTYCEDCVDLAKNYKHMTAKQAAKIAKDNGVSHLFLTHYSARYANEECFQNEAREIFPNAYSVKDLKVFNLAKYK